MNRTTGSFSNWCMPPVGRSLRRIVAATALAAVAVAPAAESAFQHKIAKVVSGYDASRSALRNFPVLVRIPADTAAQMRSDGADIRFSSVDGQAEYAHEIDAWNPEGESTVWVLLPELENGASFVMEWGDPDYAGPAVPWAKGAVWDAAGYAGVWHMTEEMGPVANATSKYGVDGASLDAEPAGALKADSRRHDGDAPIGFARFTGARHHASDRTNYRAYLKIADYSNLGLGGNFVVSGWYYMTEYSSGDWNGSTRNARIFSRKTAWDSEGGFDTGLDSSATSLFVRGSGSNKAVSVAGMPSAQKAWVHVAFVFDGSSAKAYFNGGEKVYSGTVDPATDVPLPLGLGSNVNPAENNDMHLAGSFDEVRLLKAEAGADYADWIAAEYAMGADPEFLKNVPLSETTPVVSVSVTPAQIREWIDETAEIVVSRPEDSTLGEITVNLSVSGSPELVSAVPSSARLRSGEASVSFQVSVEDNDEADGTRTLEVSVLPGDGYEVGVPSSAALAVLDDETLAQTCEWTGRGDGESWDDPANWSSGSVPTDIDSALFGASSPDGASVKLPASVEPRLIRVSSGRTATFDKLDVADGGTTAIRVDADSRLVVKVVSGTGTLVKTGSGTLAFTDNGSTRRTGETDIEEGRVEFGVHNSFQLGNRVVIGGTGAEATLWCVNTGGWAIDVFNNSAEIIVRDKGVFDCSGNKRSNSELRTMQLVSVEKGGLFRTGAWIFVTTGVTSRNFWFEGDVEPGDGVEKAGGFKSECGFFVIPASRAAAFEWHGRYAVQCKYDGASWIHHGGRLQVEDIPDVPVEFTMHGPIVNAYNNDDGVEKTGDGVARFTSPDSVYGGSGGNFGKTQIRAGTLLVDNESGSGTGKSRVEVLAGGTLGGVGIVGGLEDSKNAVLVVGGNATAKAAVHPGTIDDATGAHVVGTLVAGSEVQACPVSFNANSALVASVGRNAADRLLVHGTVQIADSDTVLALDYADPANPVAVGGSFAILEADEIVGRFAETTVPDSGWKVSYEGEDGVVKRIMLTLPDARTVIIIR